MAAWWDALSLLQQIFIAVAVPATVILFIQTILMLFGLGSGGDSDAEFSDTSGLDDVDGGTDTDFDHDNDFDSDTDGVAGLRLFTVRGLVAFFSVGGWVGAAVAGAGGGTIASTASALISGFLALILVAFFFKWALSLQENGNHKLSDAIGKTGEVYMRIPASRVSKGKINVIISETLIEADAVTDDLQDISPRQTVEITAIEGTTFIVKSKA